MRASLLFLLLGAVLALCDTQDITEIQEIVETYALIPVEVSPDGQIGYSAEPSSSTPTGGVPPSTNEGNGSSDSNGACTCAFPQDSGLVAVTPQRSNAGSENMVVPNVLSPNVPVQLAIPDDTAWKAPGAPHTGGAHYYLNPPEVSKDEACGWGSAQNGPHGNWAPYVVGSVREIGQAKTYVMLGWNPVYLEAESPWRQKKPSFGVRVNCHGDCTNTGCAIDPSVHDINEVNGQQIPGESTSKGPANNYCMVSASDGQEVEVEVFLR
ncbi:MAG: hypothetical protein Q9159_007540 [Coniocarpon cinnabarinum]